eukprot:510615_1
MATDQQNDSNEQELTKLDKTEQKQDENNKIIETLPKNIEECNNEQIIYVLKNSINELNRDSLNNNKTLIINYFESNAINGQIFSNMSRKDFANLIVQTCDNSKKLRGIAMKLYKSMKRYFDNNQQKQEKQNENATNENENKSVIEIDNQQLQAAKLEINEQKQSDTTDIDEEKYSANDLKIESEEIIFDEKTEEHEKIRISEFPVHLNVALFGISDDEYLEMLIDDAILNVCYGKKFQKLWTDP